MRLVVITQISDGYTFSCNITRPVEYESAEAFLVDLEQAAKEAREKLTYSFYFAGYKWSVEELGYMHTKMSRKSREQIQEWIWTLEQVDILTVDEWFNRGAHNQGVD